MPEYTDSLIIYFLLYSFLGYICEVAYCSVLQRRLVNRGFLYGPYLPIYGFGALLVLMSLERVAAWPLLVFVLAMLLTSALEYFSSWLLEKLFSVKLWDYSSYKMNLNGRVCLRNSLMFGILGLVVEYLIHPFFSRLIEGLPSFVTSYLSEVIILALAVDTTLSVVKMLDFKKGIRRLKELREEMEQHTESLRGLGKQELAAELRARLERSNREYAERFYKSCAHLVKAHPSITARNEEVRAQLEALKRYHEERKALVRKFKADMRESRENYRSEVRSLRGKDDDKIH